MPGALVSIQHGDLSSFQIIRQFPGPSPWATLLGAATACSDRRGKQMIEASLPSWGFYLSGLDVYLSGLDVYLSGLDVYLSDRDVYLSGRDVYRPISKIRSDLRS